MIGRAHTRIKPRRRLSALSLGTTFVVVALVAGVTLFQKAELSTLMRSGETIEIGFAQAHRLRASVSEVKVAGVEVGVVTSVDRNDDGSTTVSAKLDDDVLDTLGSEPSAAIRPTTMLGGNYYVEIVPGGRRGGFTGSIPADRTTLPVELDGLASALPGDARSGARAAVRDLDDTLAAGGSTALRDLVASAPDTLRPLSSVLRALRGTDAGTDLARLVAGVESTSRVFSSEQSRLGPLLGDLATSSQVLEGRSSDLARTTATMPGTLDETDQMLGRLDTVLSTLEETSEVAGPSIRELGRVLEQADPVLARARPVVHDLRAVLRDARPLTESLIPISNDLDATVNHLRGPVLDRVNGPILGQLLSGWHGTGEYAGGGASRPLFKEIGYMFANLAAANMMDRNGSMISFLPGIGPGSLSGLPFSLEQIFAAMIDSTGGTR